MPCDGGGITTGTARPSTSTHKSLLGFIHSVLDFSLTIELHQLLKPTNQFSINKYLGDCSPAGLFNEIVKRLIATDIDLLKGQPL